MRENTLGNWAGPRRVPRRELFALLLFGLLVGTSVARAAGAQPGGPGAVPPADAGAGAVQPALAGSWLGSLEYRDYSNDARVTLPTLLTVGRRDGGFVFFYTFDDGAGKVVRDREQVSLNLGGRTYAIDDGSPEGRDAYRIDAVEGFVDAANGGTFVAFGSGTENDLPVEVRETVTVSRTTLTLLRETRSRGSSADFAFRHRYRFSRISPMP